MATTNYDDWADVLQDSNATVRDAVTAALGDYVAVFAPAAIEADYRQAINATLPDGVTLHERLTTGPYPRTIDLTTLRESVESVDFWAIVEQHSQAPQ